MTPIVRLARRAVAALEQEPRYRPLIAVLLLFVGLGALHAIVVPPLAPIDERVHFSYALEVGDGHLPEIETPVRADVVGLSHRTPRNTIWVANHPPLFYALQAAVIGDVATAAEVPAAVMRGRVLSLGLTVVGLWFVFLCLRELTPPGSQLPILALALTVVVPQFAHIMAFIHNDTLAFLVTACTLHASILILKRGFTPRRYGVLLLFTTLGVAVRLSGLTVALASLTALAIASYQFTSGSIARRTGVAGATVAGVLVCIAISSGWFYLRNYELYGELSGASVLFAKFGRHPHGSFPQVLFHAKVWWNFAEQLWGYYAGSTKLLPTTLSIPKCVGLAAAAGLLLHAATRSRRLTLERMRGAIRDPTVLSVLMLVGLTSLTIVSVFAFYSRGGSAHARYLLPLLWCIAAIPAIGLRRLGRYAPGFAVTALLVTHLLTLDTYVAKAHETSGGDLTDLLLASVALDTDIQTTTIVVMLLAVAAGLAVVLAHLGARAESTATDDAAPQAEQPGREPEA